MKPFQLFSQWTLFVISIVLQVLQIFHCHAYTSSKFGSLMQSHRQKIHTFFQTNTDFTVAKDYMKENVNELTVNPLIDVTRDGKQAICVIGGGFGGLYTALKLDSKIDHNKAVVYLIDPKDRFVFLPLLFELSVGSASMVEVAPKYEDLLSGSKIKFIRGNVYNINLNENVCDIITPKMNSNDPGSLQPLKYSKLILATGNQPRSDLIPGAQKNSIPFYSIENAYESKNRLDEIMRKYLNKKFIQISIIGGSYSGVELALNIAKTVGKNNCNVNIIERGNKILPFSKEYNRDVAQRALDYSRVTVRYNNQVKEVKEDGLVLLDETQNEYFLASDLILFTAGSQPSSIIKQLDIEKDPRSQKILVTDSLCSKQYSNVFALGDCSLIEGNSVPATAQVAMQQSFTIAKNILRQLKNEERKENKPLEKFQYLDLGEMLSLGDYDATISSLNGWFGLSGPLAFVGRRAVYALRMPTTVQSVKAGIAAGAVTTGKFISNVFSFLHHEEGDGSKKSSSNDGSRGSTVTINEAK